MKASTISVMSISRLLSLITLLGFFHLAADTANAQRESFDASVVKERSEIAKALTATATEIEISIRIGIDISGERQQVPASKTSLAFDNVYFKLDSTEIRDLASRKQLEEIAAALRDRKVASLRFLIEGHTCDLGEAAYNLRLSANRAEAVRQFLIKQGISSERLAVLGFGEEDPAVKITAKQGTPQCELQRQQNRRVVLRVIPRVNKQ